VTYCYDNLPNGDGTCPTAAPTTGYKWRLTRVGNSNSSTTYTAFDPVGRVQTSTQTTGASYTFTYLYNKLGGLKQEQYPSQSSQRQIANVFDAAGRITTVTGTVGGNVTTYATGVVYDPTGPMVTLPLNNGVTETWTLGTYQKQPTALVAAKNGTPKLLSLGWSYGPDASNNGNVMGATIGSTYHQSFTYDPINRLKTASETGGSGWQQTYVYECAGRPAWNRG
jgi:hypothetical protein